MKVNEFKAWFEGFTECITGIPNKKQWERIKEKVEAIDGKVIVEREYIDRWYPRYLPYWYNQPYSRDYITCNASSKNLSAVAPAKNTGAWTMNHSADNAVMLNQIGRNSSENFDSVSAMYALGKAEASEFK